MEDVDRLFECFKCGFSPPRKLSFLDPPPLFLPFLENLWKPKQNLNHPFAWLGFLYLKSCINDSERHVSCPFSESAFRERKSKLKHGSSNYVVSTPSASGILSPGSAGKTHEIPTHVPIEKVHTLLCFYLVLYYSQSYY